MSDEISIDVRITFDINIQEGSPEDSGWKKDWVGRMSERNLPGQALHPDARIVKVERINLKQPSEN